MAILLTIFSILVLAEDVSYKVKIRCKFLKESLLFSTRIQTKELHVKMFLHVHDVEYKFVEFSFTVMNRIICTIKDLKSNKKNSPLHKYCIIYITWNSYSFLLFCA